MKTEHPTTRLRATIERREALAMTARGIVILLLAALAALSVSCGRASGSGQLTLVNAADAVISSVEVEVSDQSIVFEDIAPNEKRTDYFDVRADSSYRVKVVFSSGQELVQEVGYVTAGADTSITIDVTETTVNVGAVEFK